MYYTSIPDSDTDNYQSFSVDDKIFYYKKEKENIAPGKKRRYSDQFSDPHFKLIDNYRRLSFFTTFFFKNDLNELTEKYKHAIQEAIEILKNEGNIDVKIIYKHFALSKYGFDPEDYGINSEDEKTDYNEC